LSFSCTIHSIDRDDDADDDDDAAADDDDDGVSVRPLLQF